MNIIDKILKLFGLMRISQCTIKKAKKDTLRGDIILGSLVLVLLMYLTMGV